MPVSIAFYFVLGKKVFPFVSLYYYRLTKTRNHAA